MSTSALFLHGDNFSAAILHQCCLQSTSFDYSFLSLTEHLLGAKSLSESSRTEGSTLVF